MGYWGLSIALVLFGLLAGFSIGQPFFLVGVAMLVLGAFRHRPIVFWPPLLAVIAYNVTYWAIAPFWCSITISADGAESSSCSSLIGLSYVGESATFPSLAPAVAAGLVAAALTFVLSLAGIWIAQRSRQAPGAR